MDIVGELQAVHRCLQRPDFREGDSVRDKSGRVGRVIAARVSFSDLGIGNEFEVRWEDGRESWIDGRLIKPAGEESHVQPGSAPRSPD